MEQRIGLAEMSNATETSQQQLIRQAVAVLLAEFRTTDRDHRAPRTKETSKAQTAVPSPVPVVQTIQSVQPPRPSPDHIWVARGAGGYWRAKRRAKY
jgi:hypothetical protein